MNNPQTNSIHSIVMRRVHTVYLLKTYFTTSVLSVVAFIVALWGVGREVWVAHVFHNMPSVTNVSAVSSFYFSAFQDTRLVVQILVLLAFVAVVSIFLNSIRFISHVSGINSLFA
jgi:hypothetical protein